MNSKRCFFTGGLIGFGLAFSYLFLYRGDILFFIPTWAEIIFWPGFKTGNLVFDLLYYKIFRSHYDIVFIWVSIFCGIFAVALSYGLLFMLFNMVYRAIHGKNKLGKP
jgi:hypothetical protein